MYRAIKKKDYDLLLKLDQKVYPTDNPVTPEVLDQWYKESPEFGIVFEEKGATSGLFIVIPLSRSGWEKLISGELEEANMKDEFIFNPEKNSEIGLHGYHIEKLTKEEDFFEKAFAALGKVLKNLKKEVKVLGFSGYAVTAEGIGLAYNKLNMREREYISKEHIISKDGKLEILNDPTMEEFNKKLDQGYIYYNRCKMLVTFPGEVSLVWRYLR